MKLFKLKILTLSLLLCYYALPVLGQSIQTDFGKNRVQYHDGQWSSYESENFIVYYYQGGKEIARYTLQYAEQNLKKVEQVLEHTLSKKVEILVYQNHSDVLQTNIGIGIEQNNQGGVIQVLGNKVFLYFDGNHVNLEQQIIEGLARVHLESMVFGTNVQDVIQNALLLNLPPWFINGLVAYISKGWNSDLDSRLKVTIENGKLKNFNRLNADEQTFAGQALWQYVVENYGEVAIPNLLYITRINKSIDAGFNFVLGQNLEETVNAWRAQKLQQWDEEKILRDSLSYGREIYKTKKRRQKATLTDVKVSSSGRYIAYAHNELGKLRVFVFDTETEKLEKIEKVGFKTFLLPLSFKQPLLAWSNKGEVLAYVYNRRDVIKLGVVNMEDESKEEYSITKFQQVNGLSWGGNNNNLYLSAVRSGKTDLYKYALRNTKTTKLTDDIYDDLQPAYVNISGKEGLLFISNRLNDELIELDQDTFMVNQMKFNDFDLFFYPLSEFEPKKVYQLTNTNFADEKLPCRLNQKHYTYLSDENGIYNQFVGIIDSTLSHVDTTIFYADSIVVNPQYEVDFESDLIENVKIDSVYTFFGKNRVVSNQFKNIDFLSVAYKNGLNFTTDYNLKYSSIYKQSHKEVLDRNVEKLANTPFYNYRTNNGIDIIADTEKEEKIEVIFEGVEEGEKNNEVEVETDSVVYDYQTPFDFWEYPNAGAVKETQTLSGNEIVNVGDGFETAKDLDDSAKQFLEYRKAKARVYKPKFAVDNVVIGLDDSPVFTSGFDDASGGNGFFDPSLRGMIKFAISDLFENYKIIGGLRLPVSNLDSREFFVEYQNLKKRIDRKVLLYRKAERIGTANPQSPFPGLNDIYFEKYKTLFARYSLIYPLNFVSSFRLHTGLRVDQTIPLITGEYSLTQPQTYSNTILSRLAYVYDNSIKVGENLLQGTRLKVYAEYQKPFKAYINDANFDVSFKNKFNSFIIGTDIRHYQKIHRQITFASRFSAGASFGSMRTLYMIGATEGWIQFDPEKYIDYNTPINDFAYAFNAFAPNLRGFPFNVRNGSKYIVMNYELRFPIFAYLFNRPIKSQFLRDFQITAFFDTGTAWDEGSPFSEENRYYTYYYPEDNSNSPQQFEIRYFKNPIVYGYGGGVRSTLFGYFIKLDVGWGVDSGNRTPKPRWYFSLGYDF